MPSDLRHSVLDGLARLAIRTGQRFVGTRASRLVPIPIKRLVGDLAGSIEVHQVHGSKMFLSPKNRGWRSAYIWETYEPGMTRLLMRELKPGAVFCDIGAHIGYYALLGARLVGCRGRVVAFEPEPENASVLRRNVALNGYDHLVVMEKAVADRKGKTSLFRSTLEGSHSLYDLPSSLAAGEVIDVETVTLDEVISSLGLQGVDLVKIDAEGAEAAVLKGMHGLLASVHPPNVIIEYNPERQAAAGLTGEQFFDLLKQCGFSRIALIDDDLQLPPAEDIIHTIPGHATSRVDLFCSMT